MYRITRNIEASLIDYISKELVTDGWENIRTEKSFANVYQEETPCILVNAVDNRLQKKEIGNYKYLRFFVVNIRIFAINDGQRLDLSDWLFEKLESQDISYNEYTIKDGQVVDKVNSGNICIWRFLDNRKELVNTENLEKMDRYRHLLSFEVYVSEKGE